MTTQPNILWITTDQQRYNTIAALGSPHARTPHLDALVAQGVAFEHAYCQSPVCTPSRASYLTGRYARTTRCRQNGQTLPPDELLISRIMADHNYTCGLAGKQHLASCSDGKVELRGDDGYHEFYWSHHPQPDWEENAYSQWLASHGKHWDDFGETLSPYVQHGPPAEFHQTTWCAERAIDFLTRHQEKPWFFNFNCFDPHHPFDPPAEYLAHFNFDAMPLPKMAPEHWLGKPSYQKLDRVWAHNSPGYFHVSEMTDHDHRQVQAAYFAMIELIDDQVGRMLAALEDTGQAENTIVIFMSDHGEMLGDHGLYLKGPHFYDEAVRVPLIIRWPKQYVADLRSEALVELVDLAPTLLEACGIEASPGMQGRSLTSILTGAADANIHRDHVYSEYYNAWTHHRSYGTMLRTREEKMIVYHGVNEGEYYDLRTDPDEFCNLWEDDTVMEARESLLKQTFDASVLAMDPLPPRLGEF